MSRAPAWLRAYTAVEAASERVVAVQRGVVDGVGLGLLDDEKLAVLDAAYYGAVGTYVDEAHNRRGLFAWEEHVVRTHLRPGARVAVTGAGGGREVLALLERGHRPTGYEPHPALAAAAQALLDADGRGARVHRCGRRGWPGGEERFDAVVLGWGSYMLVPTRRERVALLAAACAATGHAGPVVLSYFELPASTLQFRTARAVAAPLRRLRRAAPPVLGDALVPNFAHHFTRRQVEEELAAAGMALVEAGSGEYGWAVGRHREPTGADDAAPDAAAEPA